MNIIKSWFGVIGIVAAILGVVFALQGLNVFGGSGMSGVGQWIYIGAAMAVVGAGVAYWATRSAGVARGIAGALGLLFVLMGGVWILQGVNILPGSFMTGDIQWSYRGAALAAVGAGLLWWASRARGGLMTGLGALGLVFAMVGAIWILQGLGVLHSGAMAGVRQWAINGAILGAIGLGLAALGMRATRSAA